MGQAHSFVSDCTVAQCKECLPGMPRSGKHDFWKLNFDEEKKTLTLFKHSATGDGILYSGTLEACEHITPGSHISKNYFENEIPIHFAKASINQRESFVSGSDLQCTANLSDSGKLAKEQKALFFSFVVKIFAENFQVDILDVSVAGPDYPPSNLRLKHQSCY
jgi:hypothetical protein